MSKLENLEPNRVFYYFEKLAGIPHGSRNTKAISDYLVSFAKEFDLEHYQDESNNVVIIKEATPGYENAEPVIIQGHMDMVCEKTEDCTIDFEKDGLDLYVDGDFLRARGTTLGGDDGIAVAYALALLESKEYAHPRLEVVITVDEEIGLLGAKTIDLSMLKGHMMLNIDSDVEGQFLTSCAGGLSINTEIPVKRMTMEGLLTTITIDGLFGGHSGAEIDKERGNADIIMGRVLKAISEVTPFGLYTLKGGLKDNAIPRTCQAQILLPNEEAYTLVSQVIETLNVTLKKELVACDPDICITISSEGTSTCDILDFASTNKIIYLLRTLPNGVQHMSMQIEGLVETSLNLGILELKEEHLFLVVSLRSSVGSRKDDLCDKVCQIIEMVGGECTIEGEYPAWEYKADSVLRQQILSVYEKLFGKAPEFDAIHAGLECGILSEKIADLDCVSFGPTNLDIHTPMERLSISSTERVWKFIVEFLKNAKE